LVPDLNLNLFFILDQGCSNVLSCQGRMEASKGHLIQQIRTASKCELKPAGLKQRNGALIKHEK